VSETAQAYWGARAAEYDDFIRRVVPRYDEMMERLLEGVPRTAVSVLELGCGTGNLSQRLVALVPGARFTFVDAAPEMAAAVRARLQAVAPAAAARSTFVVTTFEEFEPEPGAFDLVVAGLSLHHVADLGPVYRSIGRSLRPGGFLRLLKYQGGPRGGGLPVSRVGTTTSRSIATASEERRPMDRVTLPRPSGYGRHRATASLDPLTDAHGIAFENPPTGDPGGARNAGPPWYFNSLFSAGWWVGRPVPWHPGGGSPTSPARTLRGRPRTVVRTACCGRTASTAPSAST
jgi:SAM-dependent methyltransferase